MILSSDCKKSAFTHFTISHHCDIVIWMEYNLVIKTKHTHLGYTGT